MSADCPAVCGTKPPLPDKLRSLALAAQLRLQRKGAVPPLHDIPTRQDRGAIDYLASPYADGDWELWACLLLDAFGTRNLAVAHAFMRQLGEFCPDVFDGDNRRFILDGELFQQALAIVRSLKPQSEAESAIAVQAVAVHFCSMKVAENINGRLGLDARTAASLAALVKAYGTQIKTLRQIQQREKTKRQVIKVQKNVTINYDARQVHYPGGGSANPESQPHATRALRAGATHAGGVIEVPPVPSADACRPAVQIPSGEGQASLQATRRGKGKRSAER
jgi:hypothetical protein